MGFSDTQERLDLLALDKQGSLVLIENKLDDTGRDVTWQVLKYATSPSEERAGGVFRWRRLQRGHGQQGGNATDYSDRRELPQRGYINNSLAPQFQDAHPVFSVTPWRSGDDIFLNVDQIIPTKDAEQYMIGLASKSLDEVEAATEQKTRNKMQQHFWTDLLKAAAPKVPRFANISPGYFHYISAGSGIGGVRFNFVIAKSFGRVELYLDRGDKDENKLIFDQLASERSSIGGTFGGPLTWERLDNKRASRIKAEMAGDPFDNAQRSGVITFMIDAMIRFENALKEPLARVQARLRAKSAAEEQRLEAGASSTGRAQ